MSLLNKHDKVLIIRFVMKIQDTQVKDLNPYSFIFQISNQNKGDFLKKCEFNNTRRYAKENYKI